MVQSANDIVNVDRKCQKTIKFYFRVKTLRALIELQFQLLTIQKHSKWQQPSQDHQHQQLDSIRVIATANGEPSTNNHLLIVHLDHVSDLFPFLQMDLHLSSLHQ